MGRWNDSRECHCKINQRTQKIPPLVTDVYYHQREEGKVKNMIIG